MKFIATALTAILLIFTVLFPSVCASAVKNGIMLCVSRAIPSLFPFFVVSSLAVHCGFCHSLSRLFSKPFSRLGLPQCTASVFFLSLIGGYPIGALTVQSMLDARQCSKSDADRLILFCNNTGPAFFIGMCGDIIFHSVRVGIFLYFIHILSAVAILLFNSGKASPKKISYSPPFEPMPFYRCFTQSIIHAGRSCFSVICFILYFSVLIAMINPFISQFSGIIPVIITGMLELTSGLSSLCLLSMPNIIRICICSGMCAFGGLSVLFQCASAAPDCSFYRIFIGKIIHCALAVLLCFLFFPLSGL